MAGYTWKIQKYLLEGRECYVWVVLDSAGQKVLSAEAASSAAAALDAARAVHRLEQQHQRRLTARRAK
jgi:hypothetical protein